MKATDYVARYLRERKVPCVFEMSGGMITHLLDSIHKDGTVPIVSVHHEQAAAFAAEAVGRMTGIPGVAMATSGPGATNLLTGIGSCYFDSSPAVFITGQVNRHEQKGDRAVRQLGFQETDIISMAAPVTKAAWQVQNPEELPALMHRAFELATAGRPGPVLLDIPMDVQRSPVEVPAITARDETKPAAELDDPALWNEIFEGINQAARPLVLVGGGIRSGQATQLLRRFVRQIKVPVVQSLMAVDVMPFGDPLRVGMIGSYGNRWANLAIGESDYLLVLGSRLDVRQTGSETKAFKGGRTIVHVDIEAGEINNRVVGCRPVLAELGHFLVRAIAEAEGRKWRTHDDWMATINGLRAQWPDIGELTGAGINPNVFMHQLSRASSQAAAYVVDVGQHQMWAAQSLEIGPEQRFLTSGGMGSMGFALPASLGAVASCNQPVVVVAGDGGFQSNIQEMQTVVRNKFPLKIVVINNNCHGMVRQFQESYFDGRYQSTLWGYSAPDFARVAEVYGMPGRTIEEPEQADDALQWLWQDPTQPALLQVMVDTFANAYPKIAFGLPMTEMEPMAVPLEMEGT